MFCLQILTERGIFAQIRTPCLLAFKFIVARPEIEDESNVDPFGDKSAADLFFCKMRFRFTDGFADIIVCDIFPILVVLVDGDNAIFDFYENTRFLAYFACTAFLERFATLDPSAGREELLVNDFVAN